VLFEPYPNVREELPEAHFITHAIAAQVVAEPRM
jgi:hypothetical protein